MFSKLLTLLLILLSIIKTTSMQQQLTSSITPLKSPSFLAALKTLLPTLPTTSNKNKNKVTSELLMFHTSNCPHTASMYPHISRLNRIYNTTVQGINVHSDLTLFKLFERLDVNQECGGLPYFYNRKTGMRICGATSYGNFREWGLGRSCQMFYYDPTNEDNSKLKSDNLKEREILSKDGVVKESVLVTNTPDPYGILPNFPFLKVGAYGRVVNRYYSGKFERKKSVWRGVEKRGRERGGFVKRSLGIED